METDPLLKGICKRTVYFSHPMSKTLTLDNISWLFPDQITKNSLTYLTSNRLWERGVAVGDFVGLCSLVGWAPIALRGRMSQIFY